MPKSSPHGSVAGPGRRQRRLVLASCSMSILIVVLDFTALNVALPTVQRELHASVSGLQWTLAAYGLVLASLQMVAGSTGDRIGRRRTFQAGLWIFSVGSVLCAVAPTLEWLVAFRVLQAVGGAVLSPVSLSIITHTFPDDRERARAIGVWSGVAGIALAAGPLLGGVLVGCAGWRSIFWLSALVALAALVLTSRCVPESRALRPQPGDLIGQVLVVTLLAPLVYTIIEAPGRGWGDPAILASATVAALSLLALVAYERRRAEPLLDFRFFRSAPFSMAAVIALCAMGACAGFLFLSTLYLQDARGFSALRTGLWLLPMAAMTMVFAPLSGRLTGSRGPRLPLVLAGVATAAGGLMFTVLNAESSSGLPLLAGYVLIGIGYSLVAAPITHMIVSGMPAARAGVAGAIAMTSRLCGQSLGVAVTGAVLAASLHHTTHTTVGAFAEAGRPAWWILTGCGAVVALLGVCATTPWARRTADRAAALFPEPPAAPGTDPAPAEDSPRH
ncbi:MFS transporter [Streptomyces olivoreticuli]